MGNGTRDSFTYLLYIRVSTKYASDRNPLTQPSAQAFSLASLSARSLGKSERRVSLGDATAHGRVQD